MREQLADVFLRKVNFLLGQALPPDIGEGVRTVHPLKNGDKAHRDDEDRLAQVKRVPEQDRILVLVFGERDFEGPEPGARILGVHETSASIGICAGHWAAHSAAAIICELARRRHAGQGKASSLNFRPPATGAYPFGLPKLGAVTSEIAVSAAIA
jgi:hypothetical protein